MSELRGLGEVNEALKERGGSLLAISVDSVAQSADTARKHDLAFRLLSDGQAEVIKAYGLFHEDGMGDEDIALPANLLVGPERRVLWRYRGKRIQDRPDPSEILEVIRSIGEDA